jgi:hypothetical protein
VLITAPTRTRRVIVDAQGHGLLDPDHLALVARVTFGNS